MAFGKETYLIFDFNVASPQPYCMCSSARGIPLGPEISSRPIVRYDHTKHPEDYENNPSRPMDEHVLQDNLSQALLHTWYASFGSMTWNCEDMPSFVVKDSFVATVYKHMSKHMFVVFSTTLQVSKYDVRNYVPICSYTVLRCEFVWKSFCIE